MAGGQNINILNYPVSRGATQPEINMGPGAKQLDNISMVSGVSHYGGPGGSPQSDRRSEYSHYGSASTALNCTQQNAQVPSLLQKQEVKPAYAAAPRLTAAGLSQRQDHPHHQS